MLPDERAESAVGFLRRAHTFFASHGIEVKRVMTDNGSSHRSKVHALACRERGLRHLRTRPNRPRTNGKAERFTQTLLREFAYVRLMGPASSGSWPSRSGSSDTTGEDHTAASATDHPVHG